MQRRYSAALKLRGAAAFRALARLDLDVMREVAPAAPVRTYDNRYVFSGRVSPRSLVYENAYQDWSIPALALK